MYAESAPAQVSTPQWVPLFPYVFITNIASQSLACFPFAAFLSFLFSSLPFLPSRVPIPSPSQLTFQILTQTLGQRGARPTHPLTPRPSYPALCIGTQRTLAPPGGERCIVPKPISLPSAVPHARAAVGDSSASLVYGNWVGTSDVSSRLLPLRLSVR
ncbi:hypothetical protein C8R45DRAFT_1033838 [Mycena sanguinolenta]|nr:hypothetical protein C8R45DRAFT_1033838 [Mycena sanguinolenta]